MGGAAIAAREATGVPLGRARGAARARDRGAARARAGARRREPAARSGSTREREGVDEPGRVPGRPRARRGARRARRARRGAGGDRPPARAGRAQEHPWGLATAKRCARARPARRRELRRGRGRTRSRRRRPTTTSSACASTRHGRCSPSAARSAGCKKWGAARASLEQAAAAFDELGSPGWAERGALRARPRRRAAPRAHGELTPSRAARRRAGGRGLANKEIAQHARSSPCNTVEVHLSHAYAKLGVRSRAQLARSPLAAGG